MDYMNWYEKCLELARLKVNGGELSEFQKSELEKGVGCGFDNSDSMSTGNVGVLPA